MVQLLVRLVAPDGRAEEIMLALRTVLRPARADRGCTWAQVSRAEDDPQLISYVEEWTREEDLALGWPPSARSRQTLRVDHQYQELRQLLVRNPEDHLRLLHLH